MLLKKLALVFHVAPHDLATSDPELSGLELLDYEDLLNSLKLKISGAIKSSEKLTLLTLAPSSWSIPKIMTEFEVSEHQARMSRKLKSDTNTILAVPERKQGQHLPQDTVDAIIKYYQDDKYSKMCLGVKDTVTI